MHLGTKKGHQATGIEPVTYCILEKHSAPVLLGDGYGQYCTDWQFINGIIKGKVINEYLQKNTNIERYMCNFI